MLWDSFELRRRIGTISLGRLQESEAAQLIPEPKTATLSKQIYGLTRGYPLASIKAYVESAETDLSDHFSVYEKELVFDLVVSILKDYVLSHLDDLETQDQLERLLNTVSPLRRFDDDILYDLLHQVESDDLKPISLLQARADIRQMNIQTYLVQWKSARMAYTLDLPIRRLLSLAMKFQNPSRLLDIHQAMMTWYQKAMDETTKCDPSAPQSVIYLIEYIVHCNAHPST